jgi:hypothetical protein
MKVHIIFAQRKEHYPGEYGPEALACATEFEYDENPEYLDGEFLKYLKTDEFESVKLLKLDINGVKLMELLRPPVASLSATISD